MQLEGNVPLSEGILSHIKIGGNVLGSWKAHLGDFL